MRPRDALRGAIAALAMALGPVASGWGLCADAAADMATPVAGSLLLIDGNINGGRPARFDLAQLQALPATTIRTMTPWSDGESTFVGVRVRDLIDRLGGTGATVVANAIDDYQASIPMEDVRDYDVIVAYAMNGKPLPRDDKGPLWLIYPFSRHFSLQKDLYFSRSVWQLNRLTVH